MFLGKGVLKICSKFIAEHPCRSAISIKLQSNFIEIALRHGCSPVNLLHIFRTPFPKNTSRWLLLNYSGKNNLQNHLIGYSAFNYIDPCCANVIYCEHVHSAWAEHLKKNNLINIGAKWVILSSVHLDFFQSEAARQRFFLGKGVLKIRSKFTEEHPWQTVISIKLDECSPENLMHFFRKPFYRNTPPGGLLLPNVDGSDLFFFKIDVKRLFCNNETIYLWVSNPA